MSTITRLYSSCISADIEVVVSKIFIAGPLVQALLNLHGLRGTFLVLAAISANHLVLGVLMRPSDLEYSHI